MSHRLEREREHFCNGVSLAGTPRPLRSLLFSVAPFPGRERLTRISLFTSTSAVLEEGPFLQPSYKEAAASLHEVS